MSIVEYILSYVSNTDYHVASLIKTIYGDKFRTIVDPKSGKLVWEEYIDDSWQPTNIKITLRNKLSTEVTTYVMKANSILRKRLIEVKDEYECNYIRLKYKELHTLEGNLYNSGYRDKIIKEAGYLMVAKSLK
jgi:hypothetical protein